MADIVPPDVRSRMMRGIRGKDTRPEMIMRQGLHARGLRYRLHDSTLPGKPDMVFPKFRAVLFVHGCFWHGHDCHLFRWPSTRPEFWKAKISRNREVDRKVSEELNRKGWRQGIVWECALKGRTRLPLPDVLTACADWIRTGSARLEIGGQSL